MNLLKRLTNRPALSLSILLLPALSLSQHQAWAFEGGSINPGDSLADSLITDERAGTRYTHPLFFKATVKEAKEAEERANEALDYANSFTCVEAQPYQQAAQSAVNDAVDTNNTINDSRTNQTALEIRDQVRSAAAEATRNAHLAAQACGTPVDPENIYSSPFDGQTNVYPSWTSTFWDISSP